MIAVRKDILNRVMMNNRIDLIIYFYFLVINVREINSRIKRLDRRTQMINAYDITVRADHIWQELSSRVKRALQDIEWQAILQERALIVNDFNAHSHVWNLKCTRRLNATQLKESIEKHDLLINNELNKFTRLVNRAMINLILIIVKLKSLILWSIFENYSFSFDHELILLKWKNQIKDIDQKEIEELTDWNIQILMNDSKQLQLAKDFWQQEFKKQSHLTVNCTQKKLDVKIEWIETHLVNTLIKHIKTIRIIFFLRNDETKRWSRQERLWESSKDVEKSISKRKIKDCAKSEMNIIE